MLLSHYNIVEKIGEGGMATVYLAHDKKFDTNIAIKVLNKELCGNENIRKRFLAEAKSLYKMSHANIVKVTDLIEDADTVAFVMEYIDGETLKQYIEKRGKLTNEEIKDLFSQMLDAVGYVHAQSLVHRDIKPSNFMVDSYGKIKLMDFGIAKEMDPGLAEYTMTGTFVQMGTPMYMSPEQVKSSKHVTYQTDIYSLGVVLWQMVSGRKPYDQSDLSIPEIQVKIIKEPLPKLNSKWDSIIQKATEKNPESRFTDIKDYLNNLLSIQPYKNDNFINDKTLVESKQKNESSDNMQSWSSFEFGRDVKNNKEIQQIQQHVKNTTGKSTEARNEQKISENNGTEDGLVVTSSYKSLKLFTKIKVISFIIFLITFGFLAFEEERQRKLYDDNWDIWEYQQLQFPLWASIYSFIFISFTLIYVAFFFSKLCEVGYKKGINIFRIIASIFMFFWSILLFTAEGRISLSEVQVAWYIYIAYEIGINISTLNRIKL